MLNDVELIQHVKADNCMWDRLFVSYVVIVMHVI